MKKPLLTIAIPAYNVELFLRDTVKSITKVKNNNLLEILIINDGSKDNTKNIAKELEHEYNCVKLIDKQNGGHGSTINVAIKEARGTYFRLLDGDDWFDSEQFDIFLEHLKEEKADLVLSDYAEIFLKSNINRPVSFYSSALKEYQVVNLNEVQFPVWGPMLPNSTIKTELLKNLNFHIDENCFYVDQEYNLMCFCSAKTLNYYPLVIYKYRLERDGQSMERSSLIRNVDSHETVCIRLLTEYKQRNKDFSEIQKKYFENRVLVPMCNMQYDIAINYCRSRKKFLHYDKRLSKFPEFYNRFGITSSIVKFHRITKGIFIKQNELIHKIVNFSRKFADVIKNKYFAITFTFYLILLVFSLIFPYNMILKNISAGLLLLSICFYVLKTKLLYISNYLCLSFLLFFLLLNSWVFFWPILCGYLIIFLFLSIINWKNKKQIIKIFLKLCLSALLFLILAGILYLFV